MFAERVVRDYGKVLADSGVKGVYKSDNILPYPKSYIKKAIYFSLDYIDYEKALYTQENKDQLRENLTGIKSILQNFFVDTGNQELPDEPFENMKTRDRFPRPNEQDDLKLIDWR